MQACADFGRSIKQARKAVGGTHLLMLDMKKLLENLSDELASDMNIWAVENGEKESRLGYYLRVSMEGIEILEDAGEEAKELRTEAYAEDAAWC